MTGSKLKYVPCFICRGTGSFTIYFTNARESLSMVKSYIRCGGTGRVLIKATNDTP